MDKANDLLQYIREDPMLRRLVPFIPGVLVACGLIYWFFLRRPPTPWYKKEIKKESLSGTEIYTAISDVAMEAEVLLTAFGAGRLKPVAFQSKARDVVVRGLPRSVYVADFSNLPLNQEVFLFNMPVFLAEFYAHDNEFMELDKRGEVEEKICLYSLAMRIFLRSPGLLNRSFTTTGTKAVPMKKAVQSAAFDMGKQVFMFCREVGEDIPAFARPALEALVAPESRAGAVVQLFAAWALANAAPFHSGPEDKARFDKMVIDHSALALIDVEPHLKPVMQAIVAESRKAVEEAREEAKAAILGGGRRNSEDGQKGKKDK